MGHDATKVLLGATQSSFKHVTPHAGNIAAGLAVTLGASDVIGLTLSAGSLIGVSLGKDLSGTDAFCSVVRKGGRVPLQVAGTPVIGAQVQIHATNGTGVDSGTAVNAYYASEKITGVKEDGTTCDVALIDFPGGL